MNCDKLTYDLLDDYITKNSNLSADSRQNIRLHIESCQTCQENIRLLTSFANTNKQQDKKLTVPQSLDDAVFAMIDQQLAANKSTTITSKPSLWTSKTFILLAALALLVIGLGIVSQLKPVTPTTVAPIIKTTPDNKKTPNPSTIVTQHDKTPDKVQPTLIEDETVPIDVAVGEKAVLIIPANETVAIQLQFDDTPQPIDLTEPEQNVVENNTAKETDPLQPVDTVVELPVEAAQVETTKSTILYGDVNQDGKIDIRDSVMLCNSITDLTKQPAINGDYNQDGKINIIDSLLIARHNREQ